MKHPTPPGRRRWLRFSFSLRTLLIVMTLVCVGIVAKQQYDWRRRQQLIHTWIGPLVELARAAEGEITRYPDDTPQLTPPAGLPAEEHVPLLCFGILELESPEERLSALKILVESRGAESLPIIRELIPQCRHGELQATLLHALSLARNADDLPLFEKLLDSPSPVVRGAAAESIGYVKNPAYKTTDTWLYHSPSRTPTIRLSTLPPILVRRAIDAKTLFQIATSHDRVPIALRGRLEAMMLVGSTVDERTAAARALLAWPPERYSLRVAEWGVWGDDGGERLLTKAVLEENPPFVHQTGNQLATLPRNRFEGPMVIFKPIVHITADRPLAVDVEVSIAAGRPWYAFPRPDSLLLHSVDLGGNREPTSAEWEGMEAEKLRPLEQRSEGYPWIHRINGGVKIWGTEAITAVGLRWQSLIVSPQRQPWMQPPAVPENPKYRWWQDLRKVPSAWVTSQGETERFLYYDGPTTARPPLKASLDKGVLTLTAGDVFNQTGVLYRKFPDEQKSCLFVDSRQSPPRAFTFQPVEQFDKQQVLPLADQTWLSGDAIEPALRAILLQQGLTQEEAAGLLDSWRERFFQARGQRLLTLLTPDEYNRMCPLKIRPPATETVRVGIVLREF